MVEYTYHIEKWHENYPELDAIYRQHYQEMCDRQAENGIHLSPYDIRLDQYLAASHGGWLISYVARLNGKAIGYCNAYITNDMHNQDLIAQEDALYVLPEHRKGVGRKLVQFGLNDLRDRGVKRLNVSAMVDLRVALMWRRMGFKDSSINMTFTF